MCKPISELLQKEVVLDEALALYQAIVRLIEVEVRVHTAGARRGLQQGHRAQGEGGHDLRST